MSQFRRRALMGATTLSMFAAAAVPGFAFAQADAQAQPPAPAPAQPQEKAKKSDATAVTEIVVTGSRIKQREFSGPSPITVITSDENDLKGAEDTVAILQLSTVAANATQINNEFTGYVTTGGPGADTLSLRGIGGQVGPIDLNTIPASDIDHVEILKDGASSIYGSDAVAGVVNIITKSKLDGAELEIYGAPTQHGGGNQYQISAGLGKTFDKGFIHAGFDYYRQDPLYFGQRSYFACARDLATYPTGGSADIIDPATGQSKCYNQLADTVVDVGTGVYYRPNSAAVLGGGPVGADLFGWQAVNLDLPTVAATRASHALEPTADPLYLLNDAISPVSRYTFTLKGAYDLTPHVRLYGSLLLNRRDSEQNLVDQFFTYMNPGNIYNTPGFTFPLPVIEQVMPGHQTVNYYRVVLGAKGDLPNWKTFTNWTYDVYGQFSRSDASYDQRYVYADRVNATAGSAGGNGCDVNANFGDGPFSMAQIEPGVACVPVDYITAAARGAFTPQEEAFLYFYGKGTTTYNHYYIEGSTTGTLFKLPAGDLSGAFGFQLRKEELDDRPPTDVQDGNVYNYSTIGRTKGTDTIEEIYGELQIPVLAGLPGVNRLQINLSGRGSHYASYGYNGTYKAGVEWRVTDWLTARGSYGTAFRAPALYELYLADQTSYLDQLTVDPCINYASSGASLNVQKNCAAQGIPSNYSAANTVSAVIETGGGKGNLKPETSIAQTVGVVFRPKWWNLDLQLSADYYNFTISNQIQEFGAANIIYQCYNATNFPSSPVCGLFTRDLNPSSPTYLSITNVSDNYVNVARQIDQGLDVTGTWKTKLPKDVKLTVDANLAWTFYTNTILLNGAVNNTLGTVGQPNFVGDVTFKFDRGPWTLNYDLFMVSKSSDNSLYSNEDTNYHGTGQTVLLNHTAPFYAVSNVAIRRKYDKYSIEFGVRNVADAQPPAYSAYGTPDRLGTYPLSSQYDPWGRTFYFLIKGKF